MISRRVFCALIVSGSVLFAGCGSGSGVTPTELFTTTLLGANEVPSNSAPGVGTASVTIEDGKPHVILNVIGLIGSATGAHIHAGAPGTNGAVVLDLLSGAGTGKRDTSTPGEIHLDFVYTGTLSGLATGTHYVNVHTATHPGGELRGDLVKA